MLLLQLSQPPVQLEDFLVTLVTLVTLLTLLTPVTLLTLPLQPLQFLLSTSNQTQEPPPL